MELKITIPEFWNETAKQCGVPEELREDLFSSYLEFLISKDDPYIGEVDFNYWLESDHGEEWFNEHGLSDDEGEDDY